ncbi:uncharacterized protein B0P05DRAFT_588167 [Gilbertella persicaria]|uniref:uncharacterized protein n=1 Tax=Gilbertella persicaria TaxID=101096 RepID=UPI00221F0DFB|nr:uncharacterized protein B0P05DRAFT_588167 [Gilbertella persicaria]KAI8076518.1 hypothetical protein B0P05DRAFT_588167 [Gilbertella persicaria]
MEFYYHAMLALSDRMKQRKLKNLSILLYRTGLISGEQTVHLGQPKQMESVTQLNLVLETQDENMLSYIVNKFPNVKDFRLDQGAVVRKIQLVESKARSALKAFTDYLRKRKIYHVNHSLIQELDTPEDIWGTKAFQRHFRFVNNSYNNLIHGYYLSNIFTYCSNLKKLILNDGLMIQVNSEAGINHFIETLELVQMAYYPPTMFQLSHRLLGLKHLFISGWNLYDNKGLCLNDTSHHFVIDIPCTLLKTCVVINHTVCSAKDQYFYECTGMNIAESDEKMYHAAKNDAKVLTFNMKCKGIGESNVSLNESKEQMVIAYQETDFEIEHNQRPRFI